MPSPTTSGFHGNSSWRRKMFAERPAGNVSPMDFHEAVAMRAGRFEALAPWHDGHHRGVLARTCAEIEILRREDVARASSLAVSIPTISVVPVPVPVPAAATSALFQPDDIWIVDDFAGLSVARHDHRI